MTVVVAGWDASSPNATALTDRPVSQLCFERLVP